MATNTASPRVPWIPPSRKPARHPLGARGPARRRRARHLGFAVALLVATLAALAALVLAPRSARAEPSAVELAVARRLYAEATELEREGRWRAAEAKLRQVLAVKETPGVLYHLAYCQEKQGLLVEAMVDYDRAEELVDAGIDATDVKRLLGPKHEELSRRVPTLAVSLPSGLVGLRLVLDGVEIPLAVAEHAIPVNPGVHELRVTATGHAPLVSRFLAEEGKRRELRLDPVPAPEAATGAHDASSSGSAEGDATLAADPSSDRSARTASAGTGASPWKLITVLGTAGLGVAALGLGVAESFRAAAASDEVERLRASEASGACAAGSRLPSCAALGRALDEHDDARQLATLGYVGGGALALTAVALVFLWPEAAPPHAADAARVTVAPLRAGALLGVSGTF